MAENATNSLCYKHPASHWKHWEQHAIRCCDAIRNSGSTSYLMALELHTLFVHALLLQVMILSKEPWVLLKVHQGWIYQGFFGEVNNIVHPQHKLRPGTRCTILHYTHIQSTCQAMHGGFVQRFEPMACSQINIIRNSGIAARIQLITQHIFLNPLTPIDTYKSQSSDILLGFRVLGNAWNMV